MANVAQPSGPSLNPGQTHYETLGIAASATQAEVKQAYRSLVKQFHPDTNQNLTDHNHIAAINAAYEVISDPKSRHCYDLHLQEQAGLEGDRQSRTVSAQAHYRTARRDSQDADEQFTRWLQRVYTPVSYRLGSILASLRDEIDELAADPFDDELIAGFTSYLEESQQALEQAQGFFRSMPNPHKAAPIAAPLYHCLNQIGDGLEELARFTLSYDDTYLHTGQELFRIAAGLRYEAQMAVKQIT